MGLLNDFIYYNSGHECPDNFVTWSGLSLLSAVLGRRVWVKHGDYYKFYPNLYVCLVGTAGSGKSSAMGEAEKIFIDNFKDYMVSESIQSREDLLKKMGSNECEHTFKDEDGRCGGLPGAIYSFRPFYCIVDELENFLSVDTTKMIGMLVGIYGRSSFSTGPRSPSYSVTPATSSAASRMLAPRVRIEREPSQRPSNTVTAGRPAACAASKRLVTGHCQASGSVT